MARFGGRRQSRWLRIADGFAVFGYRTQRVTSANVATAIGVERSAAVK
jgi:hypothetical protein